MISLAESITDTIEQQADRALELTENDQFECAAAIINEWTTESDVSVLTKYLQQQTETIEDRFMYATIDEFNAEAGVFFFTVEPEQIDNN